MIKKQEIILGYYSLGKSKRQLAKELQISRNTVKRYLEEYERLLAHQKENPEFVSSGITAVPQYDSSQRKSQKLSDSAKQLIEKYLSANERKVQNGMRKQQMAGTDIHEALQEAGHKISYSTVNRYIRKIQKRSAEVYIKQRYAPGKAVEFDWGIVKLEINGTIKNVRMAVFTSSYSNHRWAKLFYRENMTSFLQSHVDYFSDIGHVFQEVVYDNMRVAVLKFTRRNADKVPTDALLSLSAYYHFDYRFCNARRGNEKGHVERSVEFVRRKSFAKNHCFENLEQANKQLEKTCAKINENFIKGQAMNIQQNFQNEIKTMISAPISPYDTGEVKSLRVDKFSCVTIDTNQYSVPEGHVGQMLNVKIYSRKIIVYNTDNQSIATHIRHHTKFKSYLILDHYLNTFKKKPGAFLGSVSFQQANKKLQEIFKLHFLDAPKNFIELLIFIKKNHYSFKQLQEAISRSIEIRPNHKICLDSLKMLLAQKTKTTPEPPITDAISKQIDNQCALQLASIQNQFFQHKNPTK